MFGFIINSQQINFIVNKFNTSNYPGTTALPNILGSNSHPYLVTITS